MPIPFYQQEIESKEKIMKHLYAGYLSPDGYIIDYNVDNGEENHHNEWTKEGSKIFLEYMSYLVDGKSFIHRGHDILYKDGNEDYATFKKSIDEKLRQYESKPRIELDENDTLIIDILHFFKNAYANDDFFKSINKSFSIENPISIEKNIRRKYKDYPKEYQDYKINRQIKSQMLQGFKDVCVQYLNYDSIERIGPNATPIPINEADFNFISHPRIILTSHRNINDRFYNYLIMDWEVHRLPKYKYNKTTGIYEMQNSVMDHYSSDDEDTIHEEIESIKRLVPRKDRSKYFRNN